MNRVQSDLYWYGEGCKTSRKETIDEVLEIVHKNKEEHAKYDRLLNPMWLRGYFDAQDEFREKVEALRGEQG